MNRERPIAGPGTIIGGNVVLTGILKDAGDIAIHGKIEGEVTSDRSIIIGETADIKGPVSGQIVTVAGTVRGSVDAGQKLEILPTGKIFGSIATRELIIRSGAIFIGKSTMPLEDVVEETHAETIEHSSRATEYEHATHAAVEED